MKWNEQDIDQPLEEREFKDLCFLVFLLFFHGFEASFAKAVLLLDEAIDFCGV